MVVTCARADLGMRWNVAAHLEYLPAVIASSPRRDDVFESINFTAQAVHEPFAADSNHAGVPDMEESGQSEHVGAEAIAADTVWHDFRQLDLHGRAFPNDNSTNYFERLPPAADGMLPRGLGCEHTHDCDRSRP